MPTGRASLVAVIAALALDALVLAFNALASEETFFPGALVVAALVAWAPIVVALGLLRDPAARAWALGGFAAALVPALLSLLFERDAGSALAFLAFFGLPILGHTLAVAIAAAAGARRALVVAAAIGALVASVVLMLGAFSFLATIPRQPSSALQLAARAVEIAALVAAARATPARARDAPARPPTRALWYAALVALALSWATGGIIVLVPIAIVAGALLFAPIARARRMPVVAALLVALLAVGWLARVDCEMPYRSDVFPSDGGIPPPTPTRERLIELALNGPRWHDNLAFLGSTGPHCSPLAYAGAAAWLAPVVVLGALRADPSVRRRAG